MLDFNEAAEVQKLFSSTQMQVRRDHAISHILTALQDIHSEMIFFGGTALARTYLRQGGNDPRCSRTNQSINRLSIEQGNDDGAGGRVVARRVGSPDQT